MCDPKYKYFNIILYLGFCENGVDLLKTSLWTRVRDVKAEKAPEKILLGNFFFHYLQKSWTKGFTKVNASRIQIDALFDVELGIKGKQIVLVVCSM